ncbi:DUF6025 family protein [Streptomyces triticiradicis]|uniref:Uncharacterized protein n=1 Tax=Streptomyces triticiradicis TaxID=2651189 RepID=A0A7J5D4V9_9ACTN|nr:DUF6025 family protein [Streptomyces triticiradicis]KAB1979145.1 hypothetical protein F8144_37005 [Streptomyces triticiradicis]
MSGRLLHDLDLGTAAEALTGRSAAFVPVHLGTRDVRVATLLDAVRAEPGLLPPRSGHLGNWEDIALGRSGPMDFNTAVCGGGHGFPLIYGFTQTEADEAGGDGVYLPGSLVERGRRQVLSLYTWDGRAFVRRDRSRPLFCPLVQAEVDGALVPLVEVHWQRMRALTGYRFELEATRLVAHAPLVADMLCVLLEEAAGKENPRRAFAELISHAARLDGRVSRCELRPDGSGYVLDGHRFGSARALAEAALLPLRALTEPRWFFEQQASLPPVLPVPSHLLTTALSALLGADYPDAGPWDERRPVAPGTTEDGFRVHLHWGARAMAGCPPRRGGYFGRKSTARALRGIVGPLVRDFAEAHPLCFVLLPAPVFMLCPPDTSEGDAHELAGLFKTVLSAPPEAAYDTALGWLAESRSHLSGYLLDRFRDGSGVPHDGAHRDPAVPVEPDGFRDLTLRQASALVAAFEEALA